MQFVRILGAIGPPTISNFGGFGGGHGSGYMGLAANMWVLVGAQIPVLSPIHHPNPSQGRQKGLGKSGILRGL